MRSKEKINWVDFGIAIVLYLLSAFIFYESSKFRESIDNSLDPSAWPRIICTLLSIAATVLLVGVFRRKVTTNITIENKKEVFIMIGTIILYGILLKPVGFVICTIALMAFILWLLKIRNALPLILVPIASTTFIYVLFHYALRVPLPGGWLQFLA